MKGGIRFGVKFPDPRRALARERAGYERDLRRAQIESADEVSVIGQRVLRDKMVSMRLGRLGNAVGQTSTLRKGDKGGKPYGVLFARGGDNSRAGGALEVYGRGGYIEPDQADWLWIPQAPVPRKIGRKRTTPKLFMESRLMGSIGKLEFRQISNDRALFVIKRVTVSPKDGRAKAMGPRKTRTRIPMKEVVAFVGIKITRRSKRFDKDSVLMPVARMHPQLAAKALERLRQRRG